MWKNYILNISTLFQKVKQVFRLMNLWSAYHASNEKRY